MKNLRTAILILPFWFCVISLYAQTAIDTLIYSKMEVMIPMRDGVRLHTVIYAPVNAKEER
jgi:hypothetical protein